MPNRQIKNSVQELKKAHFGHEIARLIRGLRQENSLTQKEFGFLVGSSHTYVEYIEKGTRIPSLEFAFRIERRFGLNEGPLSRLIIEAAERHASNRLKLLKYLNNGATYAPPAAQSEN